MRWGEDFWRRCCCCSHGAAAFCYRIGGGLSFLSPHLLEVKSGANGAKEFFDWFRTAVGGCAPSAHFGPLPITPAAGLTGFGGWPKIHSLHPGNRPAAHPKSPA